MATLPTPQPTEQNQPKCGILVDVEAKVVCGENGLKECSHCGTWFCGKHTSNVDLTSCSTCTPSVEVEINKESKRSEEYDEWSDEIKTHTFESKRIHFSGAAWIAQSLMIAQLPDGELRKALEYHKGIVTAMELELTTRKIDKSKKMLAVRVLVPRKPRVVSSVETTKKRTVTKKAIDPMQALMQMAQAGKLSPEKMQEMLTALLKKKQETNGTVASTATPTTDGSDLPPNS